MPAFGKRPWRLCGLEPAVTALAAGFGLWHADSKQQGFGSKIKAHLAHLFDQQGPLEYKLGRSKAVMIYRALQKLSRIDDSNDTVVDLVLSQMPGSPLEKKKGNTYLIH